MRGERGQATVEWIGILLLVALALAALARSGRGAEDHALASTLAHSITEAAGREAAPDRGAAGIGSDEGTAAPPPPVPHHRSRGFTAPPLIPGIGETGARGRLRLPDLPEPLRGGPGAPVRLPEPALLQRARRGAGAAWRRAWYACLIYERFRWAFLHPESRFPGYTMPPAEVLRIMNDCVSPVDLVRDWPLLRGGIR